ncbi:protein translocase subunit SecD [Propionicicella superfundia]|uniref:protein translocase subunit SecD n=1 Tax=Propionicicella superfundia TaxID=348582 RepID=UPI000687AE57|nr:protein translocase subunit SecD [Propionicicella superfundia]
MAATGAWAPKLGLDLRGGTTITLTASSDNGTVDADRLERARSIIQQRVDSLGVGESEVTTSGDRQIVVSVPNVEQEQLIELVGQTARLTFRAVYQVESVTPVATASPTAASTTATSETSASSTQAAATASASPSARRPLPALPTAPPSTLTPRPTAAASPAASVDTLLAYTPSSQDSDEFSEFNCGEESPTPDVTDQPLITCSKAGTEKFLLGPVLLEGTQLTSAQAGVPQNSLNWVVNLQFNSAGATDFETVTGELATRTSPENSFAIVLDGEVISYPSVSSSIAGGGAEISGSFTQQTATELANVLKYGALPLSFEVSSVDTVSPTLGGDQLRAGIIAGLIGLGLVVIFAVTYYRGLAIVVVASLALAGVQTWALMALLGQSVGFALNLPGVAGAIVAIGVTADSFIIYFERIRDEVREGRPLTSAIETGWIRSRHTILVADGVSLLSAVVLFFLAVGSVKGFAFTLGLTTLLDILIVFFFTKPLVSVLGRTKFFGGGHPMSGFGAEHMGVSLESLLGRRRTGVRRKAATS